ncbi:MAG: 50S ribosomal protein L25 [bacterium]
MERTILDAHKREQTKKEYCRKIRRDGLVPGVVYGKGMEPMHLTVGLPNLEKVIHTDSGLNVIIDLKVKDEQQQEASYLAMIGDLQRDVFQKRIIHVDFHKISLEDVVTATVPVILTGEAPGVKEGGVLDHILWEMEVESLPLQIPEHIEVDISSLKMEDAIHVKDIALIEGVKFLASPEEIIVVVHPPRKIEETPAEAEAALAALETPETTAVPTVSEIKKAAKAKEE